MSIPPNTVSASPPVIDASACFLPSGTVRCTGKPSFRSQLARDFACLLDLDRDVSVWSCFPFELQSSGSAHVPDFAVERHDGRYVVDVQSGQSARPSWIPTISAEAGYRYLAVTADVLPEFRLQNARDLLRYAKWTCPLGDRIRILGALDEHGSLTLAECLSVFQETRPIAGLASLILHRHLEIELDDALIGPETQVRRFVA